MNLEKETAGETKPGRELNLQEEQQMNIDIVAAVESGGKSDTCVLPPGVGPAEAEKDARTRKRDAVLEYLDTRESLPYRPDDLSNSANAMYVEETAQQCYLLAGDYADEEFLLHFLKGEGNDERDFIHLWKIQGAVRDILDGEGRVDPAPIC